MLSFIHTKQTSKNVANTTFNDFYQQGQGIGQNSNFWALGPHLKSLQVASEKFVNLQCVKWAGQILRYTCLYLLFTIDEFQKTFGKNYGP